MTTDQHICPDGYKSELDLFQTQRAIMTLKNCFQQQLGAALNLTRVSAPLFVWRDSGLNDDLSGWERKVGFDILESPEKEAQVVQSLAKWKRAALSRYGYPIGRGLYTDMNAIRRDERTDNLHSIYVDQWDWEKVISRGQRSIDTLKDAVMRIHDAVLEAEAVLHSRHPSLQPRLPQDVFFITARELYDLYPNMSPEAREQKIVKDHHAVFIMGIGDALPDGLPHSKRAPDYDDWDLNGDLLYYHPELDCAVEISSMGIRVDASSMFRQLSTADARDRLDLPFHQGVMNDELPLTMGGGIGQSRLCMLLLRKAHIGEVQASIWPDGVMDGMNEAGVFLL